MASKSRNSSLSRCIAWGWRRASPGTCHIRGVCYTYNFGDFCNSWWISSKLICAVILFLKGLSGDAHIDDDERFTTGTRDGINLDWVAVHEFGHSLGLENSGVLQSIMHPWYRGYVADITLNNIKLTIGAITVLLFYYTNVWTLITVRNISRTFFRLSLY